MKRTSPNTNLVGRFVAPTAEAPHAWPWPRLRTDLGEVKFPTPPRIQRSNVMSLDDLDATTWPAEVIGAATDADGNLTLLLDPPVQGLRPQTVHAELVSVVSAAPEPELLPVLERIADALEALAERSKQ